MVIPSIENVLNNILTSRTLFTKLNNEYNIWYACTTYELQKQQAFSIDYRFLELNKKKLTILYCESLDQRIKIIRFSGN